MKIVYITDSFFLPTYESWGLSSFIRWQSASRWNQWPSLSCKTAIRLILGSKWRFDASSGESVSLLLTVMLSKWCDAEFMMVVVCVSKIKCRILSGDLLHHGKGSRERRQWVYFGEDKHSAGSSTSQGGDSSASNNSPLYLNPITLLWYLFGFMQRWNPIWVWREMLHDGELGYVNEAP